MIKLLNNDWSSNEDNQDEEETCGVCGGLKEDGFCPDCENKDEGLVDDTDEPGDDDNGKE